MHVRVMHHGRKWRRANNHMDARHCPQCGATVHGNEGQHAHLQWHVTLTELLEEICDRAKIEGETWTWTAAVDSQDDNQEAIGGLQGGAQREE